MQFSKNRQKSGFTFDAILMTYSCSPHPNCPEKQGLACLGDKKIFGKEKGMLLPGFEPGNMWFYWFYFTFMANERDIRVPRPKFSYRIDNQYNTQMKPY